MGVPEPTTLQQVIDNFIVGDQVQLGKSANATDYRHNVAIGLEAYAGDHASISVVAIGEKARATLPRSVAIGVGSIAEVSTEYGSGVCRAGVG